MTDSERLDWLGEFENECGCNPSVSDRNRSLLINRLTGAILEELRSASKDTERLDWLGQKRVTGTIAVDAERPIYRRCVFWGANQTPREAIDAAAAESSTSGTDRSKSVSQTSGGVAKTEGRGE